MAVQTQYTYQPPRGVAGALIDISPYAIDSRNNEAADGAMMFGMGAVKGTSPGVNVNVPTSTSTADQFEGVVMTSFTEQMDMAGDITLKKGKTVGILRWGRAWVRVPSGVTPAYGDAVYLVISGTDAGKFTNTSSASTIAINARFRDGLGSGNIAPIELYNQKQG